MATLQSLNLSEKQLIIPFINTGWNLLAENGPFSFFFALTLGTNQCSLINNWVPHHSSVFSFQNLLNCDSTDAFRADSAVAPGLSAGLIQSAVELLWACFLLPCLSTLQYNRRWYSLCLCVRATLLFHESSSAGFLWSYPAAFSRKCFTLLYFPTNRRAELKKRWFQRWEHRLIPDTEEIISSSSSWMWKDFINGWGLIRLCDAVIQKSEHFHHSHRNQLLVVYTMSHCLKSWSSQLLKLFIDNCFHIFALGYIRISSVYFPFCSFCIPNIWRCPCNASTSQNIKSYYIF